MDNVQPSSQPIIAIVAGEHSGDLLGEGLIKSLKSRYPKARFVGIGGPKMLAQGFESLFDMEELSVMGLVEVLGRLRRLFKIKAQLIEQLVALDPAVYIGIDAPDFNLRIEKALKARGIKTVHYVSPSVWAWREKRIFNIAKATNMVLSLLPFEKAFYDKFSIPCTFVGHPLADQIPMENDKVVARQTLGLKIEQPVLAILPGSRGGELAKLTTPFLQVALKMVDKHPLLQCVVPVNNAKRKQQFLAIKAQVAPNLAITIVEGQSKTVMASCDAMLMSSGTATLEAALIKRPAVVAYILNKLTFALVKRLYKPQWVSLPNILANKALMPEFLQEQVNDNTGKGSMFDALEQRLFEPQTDIIETCNAIHLALKHDASEQAANAVEALING